MAFAYEWRCDRSRKEKKQYNKTKMEFITKSMHKASLNDMAVKFIWLHSDFAYNFCSDFDTKTRTFVFKSTFFR